MSVVAWVDVDHRHSDEMDRLLDAFREPSTLDEIGIGTVRDTLSDLLFPGTSTLHSRARYLLFTAWGVTSVAERRLPLDRALEELRRHELTLVEALIEGQGPSDVIGSRARASLQTTPTQLYWTALSTYRIKKCNEWRTQHLRAVTALPRHSAEEEDAPAHRHTDPHFVHLPQPPSDLLESTTFELTTEEAGFLHERIQATCGGSYLAWLLNHRTIDEDIRLPWDPHVIDGLDGPARAVHHARRFSDLIRGGSLVYTYLVAQRLGDAEAVQEWGDRAQSWATSPEVEESLAEWDRDDFWDCVIAQRRINFATRLFIDSWVSLIREDPVHGWRSEAVAALIREREMRLKRRRSRFLDGVHVRPEELGYGTGQLTYRWANTRVLVNDIRVGRGL